MKFLLCITLAFVTTATVAAIKSDGPPEYLHIRPTYRKESQLPVKPGHNPFRRVLQTEDREIVSTEINGLASQMLAALGKNPVSGVLESSNGVPTAVISGDVYTVNDEVRLAGNKPVVDGYRIIVRSIKRNEVALEAYSKSAKTATSVPLVIPLDDFFDEK